MTTGKRPTAIKFLETCRKEFLFLKEYGFHEVPQEEERGRYEISFKNNEYMILIEGIHHGDGAIVSLFDTNGREALPIHLVPKKERKKYTDIMGRTKSQLDEIRTDAMLIKEQCASIFKGDRDKFEMAAREWKRMRNPGYARSLQKRKLP